MSLGSKITLGFILLASLLLMVGSSLQEAATMDELAHIPAGYGYVKHLDYRLNPEHPPLVKMAAGVPLLFLDLNFPTDNENWQEKVNAQWDMGGLFLYGSGNDADQIVQWSRLGPMILTLLLIILVYVWARTLMGDWWALLPALATGLSPNFLAHGHYVTTDIGAALGIIASLYYFTRYLTESTKKNLILAGAAFGFAQLMKFSAAILVPHMILLAIIAGLVKNYQPGKGLFTRALKSSFRHLGKLFLIFIIGGLIVYAPYFAVTANYPIEKQMADTQAIVGTLPAQGPAKLLADFTVWGSDKPLIRPYSQYLLGLIMVVFRAAGGNTAYFLGQVSTTGNPSYFPLVYLMKESIPMLILILLAGVLGVYHAGRALIKRAPKLREYLTTNLHEFSMLLFIAVYTAYSVTSPLNIGVRHLMPIIPMIYIVTVGAVKKYVQADFYTRQLKAAFVMFLFAWFTIGSVAAYPHYLPYFNEFIGTDNGWKYVTDSNYDWGQDLKRLAAYTEENDIDQIAVNYFGGGSVQYYLGDRAVDWYSSKGNPAESGIEWLAISVNQLQNAIGQAAPGFNRDIEDEYRWLQNPTFPDAVVGKSIFIYRLPPVERD